MQFENVTVVKEANIYLDGKVTSRTVLLEDGTKITLGIMQPGEFTFEVKGKERKEIITGNFEVRFGEETEWKRYTAGDILVVPPNITAYYRVHTVTDYCFSTPKE